MILRHPLNALFHSWQHVAVLRVLLNTTYGKSGSQIARESGMHPLTALKALTALEELGIVLRQRGGRDHIFTLRRQNAWVKNGVVPLLDMERKFEKQIMEIIANALPRSILSAAIFGSVARGEEIALSDLDLFCLVQTQATKTPVREALYEISETLRIKYNVRLSPLLLTLREAQTRSHSGLIRAVVSEGRVIAGKPLQSFIHDDEKKTAKR